MYKNCEIFYHLFKPDNGLNIIGARPSMGKTTLMLQAALSGPENALVYSLDAPFEVIYNRVKHIKETINCSSDKSIYVRDDLFTIEEICRDAQSLNGIIFIDCLQNIRSSKKFNNIKAERRYIAARLKALSHDKCVIVFSQINRNAEKRQGHIPLPKDIRFYENIDKYADDVLTFVHDDYYHESDKEYCNARFYYYCDNYKYCFSIDRNNITGTFLIK